jgi:hypothetical protein
VALSFRVAFFVHQVRLIPTQVLATIPFENEVGSVAQALVQGQGFCCLFRQPTGPTAWLTPVYPFLLAGIFRAFGIFTIGSFYAAALLNCIFSASVALPLYFAAKRIGGVRLAVVGAWIWAIFPSGIMIPTEWIWDTALSALLASVLLWAPLALEDSFGTREAVAYGLLWGFSLLTNPALGALLPFLLGWVAYRRYRLGRLQPASVPLVLVLAVCVCLPWTIRNAVRFHQLIPLRSNFPFELWRGNNEIFDEHSRQVNRITRFEQVHLYAQLGETAYLNEKWRQAHAFLYHHPGLALRLWGRRAVATWLGTETPWEDFSHADSLLVRFIFLWNAVILIGVLVGLGRLLASRNPYFVPLAGYPFIFPLVYYITQTSLRLRHPCDPILALLLAVALIGVGPFRHTSAEAAGA